jgi:hypothetical protein
MRESRTCGSESEEAKAFPTPIVLQVPMPIAAPGPPGMRRGDEECAVYSPPFGPQNTTQVSKSSLKASKW